MAEPAHPPSSALLAARGAKATAARLAGRRRRDGLYRAAYVVGRDHLSATIHTLVLAYAGATLPLLLSLLRSLLRLSLLRLQLLPLKLLLLLQLLLQYLLLALMILMFLQPLLLPFPQQFYLPPFPLIPLYYFSLFLCYHH